jgi:hypothetical protein
MFGSIGVPELILLAILCIPGAIGAAIAASKGRSAVGWFFLCAFFWIPILVVIFLPPIKEVPGRYRQCPSCKEFIKWGATICKHCGTSLSPQ